MNDVLMDLVDSIEQLLSDQVVCQESYAGPLMTITVRRKDVLALRQKVEAIRESMNR